MGGGTSAGALFNEKGRRVPSKDNRVFDIEPLEYYHVANGEINFASIAENYKATGYLPHLSLGDFQHRCEALKLKISLDSNFSGLLNGVHVPFVLPKLNSGVDIAESIFEDKLPYVGKSFTSRYPEAYFKAIMQGGASLKGNLTVSDGSRYDQFLATANNGPIMGWYFPQALQQFDLDSQVAQMRDLPNVEGVCLSGPAEIFAALIGKPDLLINEHGYSPILCMSALQHSDDRLTLVVKSYGPHLEVWCLSQMLTPGVKQVSEQWSGGITFFCPAD